MGFPESDLHSLSLHARMASHGDTSAHEQRPPTEATMSMAFALILVENTYQSQPICLRACGDEVHDGTVLHPLGNHHQGL